MENVCTKEIVIFFDSDGELCNCTCEDLKESFLSKIKIEANEVLRDQRERFFCFFDDKFSGYAVLKPMYTNVDHQLYGIGVYIEHILYESNGTYGPKHQTDFHCGVVDCTFHDLIKSILKVGTDGERVRAWLHEQREEAATSSAMLK